MKTPLSFGTLGASLAKAQTQEIIDRLQSQHNRLTCQMTIVPRPGGEKPPTPEPYLAATTADVEFLEEQLLAGEFRLVIQRAMDLVLPLREGLIVAAVPERNTPFDALLNRQGLIADELADGAVLGVLNLRTRVQLQALFPRLAVRVLPGGVDAALELLLRRCDVDGLVMPAAVTEHLGIQGIVTEIFYPEVMLPSAGQGILVILARENDREACDLLRSIHSEDTAIEMEAEHAFMQRFTSDQDLPVSVLAQVERQRVIIEGAIGSIHGRGHRIVQEGPVARASQLAAEVAEKLLLSEDAVIDLLEADFPDGLPDDDESELDAELKKDLAAELDSELEASLADDLDDDLPETDLD